MKITILLFLGGQVSKSQSSEIRITVNSANIIDTIEPIWNGIGGSSGLALTPQGERLLQRIVNSSPYPFYRRIWGVTSTGTAVPFAAEADWGSTNVYQVDKKGDSFYDFTLFDQIFDIALKGNFIPIVHLGSTPDSLSSAPDSIPHTKENLIDGMATRSGNKIQVMIYNYNENVDDRELKKVQLSVMLPSSGTYKLIHYRIDENHSNAYTIWKSMSKPFNPNEVQIEQIKDRQELELFEPERLIKINNGKVTIPVEMPHHSVSLFVFELVS